MGVNIQPGQVQKFDNYDVEKCKGSGDIVVKNMESGEKIVMGDEEFIKFLKETDAARHSKLAPLDEDVCSFSKKD